jgi:hypothetical protein
MINAIQSGEFYSPHKTNRTGTYDETGAWSTMVPAQPAGTGKKPGKAGEVYFIQVEGGRRPAGLFLACHPFALPDRVRKKVNHYAEVFLRRLGRRR